MELQDKKRINLNYLRANSKIVFPLYSSNGVKILNERIVLTSERINELIRRYGNIVYGHETDKYSAIPQYRIEMAVDTSRDIIDEISFTKKLTKTAYKEAEKVIDGIISDINSSEIEVINLLKNLKIYEEYLYQHSVNVGVLSAIYAKLDGNFTAEQIRFLALGAYLLDIGLTKVDKYLLSKTTKYTSLDIKRMKQHPQFGYEMLKNISGVDPIVLQTLLFHHEKNNYKGYYQLPYDLLPAAPKIVSVCDIYDALTTPRPYRKEISPTKALRFLVNSIGIYFDYQLISDFVNNLGPLLNNTQSFYAKNDFCELNTKEIAMITDFSMNDYLKPKLIVYCKLHKNKSKMAAIFYAKPIAINLEEDNGRFLTKIIDNQSHIIKIKSKLVEKGLMTL